jgi:hypothetical protein
MMMTLLCRVSGVRFVHDLWSPQALPLAGAAVLALAAYGCREWAMAQGLGDFGVVALAAPAGGLAYLAVLVLARTKPLVALMLELRRDLGPVLARVPFARALLAEGRPL